MSGATCSDLQSQIARALTEQDRQECTEKLQQHIVQAQDAREYYKACIEKGESRG